MLSRLDLASSRMAKAPSKGKPASPRRVRTAGRKAKFPAMKAKSSLKHGGGSRAIFLTLSDGYCIFWRQLADDGFDFLEIFGVEQSCIYPDAPSCQHRLRWKRNFRKDVFPDNDAGGGFYKDPLHGGDEIIDFWKHFADRFTDTMETMGQTSNVKECGVEDLQFLA